MRALLTTIILSGLAGVASAQPAAAERPAAGAVAGEGFRCELGDASGVPDADARTAVRLLCEELRRASGGQGAFEVNLGTLGRVVVVDAARKDTGASVRVQVDGIEEIPTAAARLADALVSGRPLADSQRVDNLLDVETRQPPSKKGSVKWSVGVMNVEAPATGSRAPGFSVGLTYATPRFSLPSEIRFATNGSDGFGLEPELDVFAISTGGRVYASARSTSPFAGAGLSMLRVGLHEGGWPYPEQLTETYFNADRLSVAPYAEAGVEFLRTNRARLVLGVRADFPLQSLHSPEYTVYSYESRDGRPTPLRVYPERSKYVLPVSLQLAVAF